MNAFVNIIKVFKNQDERSISNLSSLYQDRSYLLNSIRSLIESTSLNDEIEGKRVLLKPNWVRHSMNNDDEVCLRTNDNIILSLLEFLLIKRPSSIVIGDAPIQGCDWQEMLSNTFLKQVEELSKKSCIPIVVKDFRRVTFDQKSNKLFEEKKSIEEYVIFDLKENSYLEPISDNKNKFRVTLYDPTRLAESHSTGTHKYCITKELFDSDVVISLPKIKTHQKTGITNALKNLVGLNGDKDFLPHHRIGGTENGGDCYPGKNIFRKYSELLMDNANRHRGDFKYKMFYIPSILLWKISRPSNEHQMAAGWYGNDTTWRMVMDLNTISLYGKKDGTISDTKQRQIFSLCDGIIGGQGNGPLQPEPLALGVIMLTNNSFLADVVAGKLMRMDIDKIHLLKAAKRIVGNEKTSIVINNETIDYNKLDEYSIKTLMPPGWLNYNK